MNNRKQTKYDYLSFFALSGLASLPIIFSGSASAATFNGQTTTAEEYIGYPKAPELFEIPSPSVRGPQDPYLLKAVNFPDILTKYTYQNITLKYDPATEKIAYKTDIIDKRDQSVLKAIVTPYTYDINKGEYIKGEFYYEYEDFSDLLTTYTYPYVKPIPEPLTILGAGTGLIFGLLFKRKFSKN